MDETHDERTRASARRIAMTLYTRAECPLCDEMKAEIARADVAQQADLEVIDIDGDPALVAQHGNSIPVLVIGGRPAFKGRCTAEELRKKLARRSAELDASPAARVYILAGPDLGKSVEVRDGATLGRSPECTVHVRDASVSRVHARIESDAGRFRIVDAGSRNGLTRSGKREASIELDDGDEFALGEVLLRFRRAAPPPAASAPSTARATDTQRALERQVAAASNTDRAASSDIELEGEWSEAPASPLAQTSVRRAAVVPAPQAAASAPSAVDPARRATTPLRTGGLAQRARAPQRSGLFGADLGQLPWWIRALLFAGALALAAVLFVLAFQGTRLLKGHRQSSEVAVPGD
ncbi:MAG: glutaredoxin family protein [Planctomycetota bacterium]